MPGADGLVQVASLHLEYNPLRGLCDCVKHRQFFLATVNSYEFIHCRKWIASAVPFTKLQRNLSKMG